MKMELTDVKFFPTLIDIKFNNSFFSNKRQFLFIFFEYEIFFVIKDFNNNNFFYII